LTVPEREKRVEEKKEETTTSYAYHGKEAVAKYGSNAISINPFFRHEIEENVY